MQKELLYKIKRTIATGTLALALTSLSEGVTSYANSHKFIINSEEMEEAANIIEEKLIENGAELYLAPTK